MRVAMADARANGFTHAAFGDLFLEDIRRYREEKLTGSGIEPLFPVWGIPTGELAEQMMDGGLRARLACVDTRRLDESFVGREFDRSLLRDLPSGVDPCGERGEFHSCVYAGPMFNEPIALHAGDTHAVAPFVWRDLTLVPAESTNAGTDTTVARADKTVAGADEIVASADPAIAKAEEKIVRADLQIGPRTR
jgi:diphthamide synthase (EF-2-diphthine--ammonia ligase)